MRQGRRRLVNEEHTSSTRTHSIGSGVILHRDGYIITNAHVLEGARRIGVTLDEKLRYSNARVIGNRSSMVFDGRIIGVFEEADLAVVKIDAHALPTIPIEESENIQPGQLVFALGSPDGLRNSVSRWELSARLVV
jgi:serine protease Do